MHSHKVATTITIVPICQSRTLPIQNAQGLIVNQLVQKFKPYADSVLPIEVAQKYNLESSEDQ